MASFFPLFWFAITDYVDPWLDNLLPPPAFGGLDPSAVSIGFDVLDDYSGVNPAALVIEVNGDMVYDGGSNPPWQEGWIGSLIPTVVDGYDGYAVSFSRDSPFSPSSAVTVQVFAQDNTGNQLNDGYGYDWTFYTTSYVEAVESGPFEITLDLLFSRDMTVNNALLDPGNYQFNGGMYARLVEFLDNDSVRLWVEGYQGDGPFELSVSSDIRDSYGYALAGSYAMFGGLVPFKSDATMSAYNGLVRTWAGRGEAYPAESMKRAFLDSQRVYLGGARGIEGFRRTTKGTVSRWAQIFDAYGVGAMFVANYDGDYIFDDSMAPFLEDQLPAPKSTNADITTDIRFSITDVLTAVEIVATAVYVSGILVFAGGGGGWTNGWSGSIRVLHRSLDFILYPPLAYTPGTSVTVRVVTSDLLDNALDSSYTFQISSAPVAGAFGSSSFGTEPFGGET